MLDASDHEPPNKFISIQQPVVDIEQGAKTPSRDLASEFNKLKMGCMHPCISCHGVGRAAELGRCVAFITQSWKTHPNGCMDAAHDVS